MIFCLFLFVLLLLPNTVLAQVIQGETPTGTKKNVQVDATGHLAISVAPSPGTQPVSKVSTATYSPAKTTTAAIAATLVEVLPLQPVLGYPNWCVTLKNNDAANPLTDAAIFQSPDGTSWESLSWTACDSLAHGALCDYCVSGNAYRYIKVQAKADVALTVSSVDAWLTANTN